MAWLQATAMTERESAWNGEDEMLVRERRPLKEIVERKRERERDNRDRRPLIIHLYSVENRIPE
jgi:hypothetical protein